MARHVVLLLCLVVVESAVLTGRALYCRDPDTGKLHALNSTWASSTFCGNYTCKLRKRNMTETQYTPLRQLNITNINTDVVKENVPITISDRTEPDVEHVHKDRADLSNGAKDGNTNKEMAVETANEITTPDEKNRFLTEKEIQSISEVLHTVKRGDLDAIVDIYNLAQDIYNEMDKATNDIIKDDKINSIPDDHYHKYEKKSYWYDSLANKGRSDVDYDSSNHIISTVPPAQPTVHGYFKVAMANQDYAKLPYYYPISQFQRTSSYMHQPTAPTIVERPKPCAPKLVRDMQPSQNLIKPSYLLPYPFAYIHPYNYSDYSSNMYFNSPHAWNSYKKQRQYQPYYNSYTAQNPVAPKVPNAVLMNPHLREDVAEIEQKPIQEDLLGKVLIKAKEKVLPAWKSEQLPSQILDEVRANIDTSKILKAFPFRNKIKLEKVGKIISLDELIRAKRLAVDPRLQLNMDEIIRKETLKKELVREVKAIATTTDPTVEEEGEYETYLVKTTCQTEAVPGYFRYGNLTQPYPECCPQLINNR